jgi:hypothetical protein
LLGHEVVDSRSSMISVRLAGVAVLHAIRLRRWIAVCTIALFAISSTLHVTAHALQPIASSVAAISTDGSDNTTLDFGTILGHCHECGSTSLPIGSEARAASTSSALMTIRTVGRPILTPIIGDPPPPRF